MTPSMLDLRAEILTFMNKANSNMTDEYATYLDPQLAKHPYASSASITQQQHPHPNNSSMSVVSQQPSILPEEHQHLAKLWDQLRSRYAGDKEGAHEMKQKIRNYIHHGIKEETQISRAYMEEMDEWK